MDVIDVIGASIWFLSSIVNFVTNKENIIQRIGVSLVTSLLGVASLNGERITSISALVALVVSVIQGIKEIKDEEEKKEVIITFQNETN